MQMINIFQQLKIAIAQTYCSRFPDCQSPLQDWKGKEIRRFQQDLSTQAQGQISEKSFYTYFKSDDIEKLPRVDVLNLLAVYVGFSDWAAFAAQYATVLESEPTTAQTESPTEINIAAPTIATALPLAPSLDAQMLRPVENKNRRLYLLTAFAAAFACVAFLLFGLLTWGFGDATAAVANIKGEKISCEFCFVDADKKTAIRGKQIILQLLKTDESPQLIYVDTLTACTQIKAEAGEKIQFVVAAPYYHKDTIIRTLSDNLSREIIALRSDDYALMLHYISKSDLKDWQQHRQKLNDFLADEVQVVQIYGDEADGIAIYNKAEFIDKLTMPIETLKDIEIIQTEYNRKGQATYIRFR